MMDLFFFLSLFVRGIIHTCLFPILSRMKVINISSNFIKRINIYFF